MKPMLTKNHETLAIEVKRHVEADAILQGSYWDGSRGCFIGCLAHSDDATKLGELYGLPLPLVRICEDIFEALPADEAKTFFAAIPDAVGRDGKDLTRVHWAFLASELRCLPPVGGDTQRAIDTVIEGMDLLASGGEWSLDAARAALAAAYATYAADAAYATYAASATYAAYVAASAASAAAADVASAASAAYVAAAAASATDAAAADAAARMRQRDTILRLISEA
jgi:hypothetical protein